MDTAWGEALGSEEGNKYRTEYSEVMMHIACTGECTVLSKYSYHGHVKLCIIINVMSIHMHTVHLNVLML